MVLSHRRSENSSLASIGAPSTTAESGREAVGNGLAAATVRPQRWQNWQDWAASPALHADHQSAPEPPVQFPRWPAAPSGPRQTRRRGRHEAASRETGSSGPSRRPTTGPQNCGFPDRGPPGLARHVFPLVDHDYEAVQISPSARDEAAAIREAAQREAAALTAQATNEAAAIREAAQRSTAELRARLDSLIGELGRITAAYVAESPAIPAMSAAGAPIPAAAAPPLPGAGPAPPGTRSARPATSPTRSGTMPGTGSTRSARPGAMPAQKPQNRPRQHQAMRVATYATTALVFFTLITGATEVGLHGFKFFLFREGGIGQTASSETDQQFLARQAAVHHVVAPKGRHHKKPHQAVAVNIK